MPNLPDFLSEDAAHRLLARAVELDTHRAGSLSVEQLRDVARDAGISPGAFEDALMESRVGATQRAWRSWARYGILNGLGLGAFYYLFHFLNQLLLPFPSTSGLMAIDILATIAGMAVALRMRGRIAAAIIGVFAAAQFGAYLGLYGLYLSRSTNIFSSWGWASLGLGSFCGVGVGALLMRRQPEPPAAAAALQQAARSPQGTSSDNASSDVKTVRQFPFPLSVSIHRTRPQRTPAI